MYKTTLKIWRLSLGKYAVSSIWVASVIHLRGSLDQAFSISSKQSTKYGSLSFTFCFRVTNIQSSDDIALYKTLLNIKSSIEQNFVCYRPTTPAYEDLLKDYSKTNKDYFLGQLGSFIQSAEKALDEKTNQKDACKAWQRHFSEDRFPFESYANTEEFIENRFSIDIQYELKIDCLVSQQGFRPHSLIEMIFSRLPLLRGKSLKFYIVYCNVPKPF